MSTSLLGCYGLFWLTDHTDSTDLLPRGFRTTEVTDLTDFVSIACSLRYLPVTSPLPDYATIKPKLQSEHAMLTKSVISVTSVVR